MGIHQIPDGEELVIFLEGLSAPEGVWVSGVGTLTEVVLTGPEEAEQQQSVDGRTQLLSLAGPASGPLMATIVTAAHAVVGGRLLRARSAGVSLFLSDGAAQVSARPVAPKPPASTPPSDDDESDEAPRYGDRVDHFVFGLCDVMTLREERMKIRGIDGGRLREIHLRAVKVLKPTVQDGRRVFKLARRG